MDVLVRYCSSVITKIKLRYCVLLMCMTVFVCVIVCVRVCMFGPGVCELSWVFCAVISTVTSDPSCFLSVDTYFICEMCLHLVVVSATLGYFF